MMDRALSGERQHFIQGILAGELNLPRVIYSRDSSPKSKRPLKYIKVVFNLDWPKDENNADLSYKGVPDKSAVSEAIFRTKSMLERALLEEISVFEIVAGCVTVVFDTTPVEHASEIASAIRLLNEGKEFYSVSYVSGHHNGKSVSI